MGGSRVRRTGVIYLTTLLTGYAGAMWLSTPKTAVLVAMALGVPGAYLTWANYRAARTEAAANLDPQAKNLAAQVKASERDQVKQLLGPGGCRIDLTFRYAPEPCNNASGADPEGHLEEVLDYYQKLEPARLVITGAAGSGKTLLALRLLQALLADKKRTEADPVPVRFSLTSWDAVQPLKLWLAEQIHERFDDIKPVDARALVEQGRILPILDGLDEMDAATTTVPHRRATRALEQLNAYPDGMDSAPLVLTCRTDQYAELAKVDVRLRDAARVRIRPVNHAEAASYLTARTTSPSRWAPVLTSLSTAPKGTLARSLNTPWRLNLATTVYEQRDPDTLAPLRDPADLLALASTSAVRDHLLARYLPAATSQHPTRPDRYTAPQTHLWLSHLAGYLATATDGPRTDVVLHQLWPLADRERVRIMDVLLALVFAAFLQRVAFLSLSTAVLSVVSAVWAGWRAWSTSVPAPVTGQLQRLRNRTQRRQLIKRTAAGLAAGLIAGLAIGLMTRPALGLTTALASGAVSVALGPTAGLISALIAPATDTALRSDFIPPTDPRHPVRDDLTFGLVTALASGLVFGLVNWLAYGPAWGLASAEAFGAFGLAFGLYVKAGAGRRYLVFLLCSRGRLPWKLGAFLHWAYEAGLLRISGMAYQFRHKELQDWLTDHPQP